MYTFPELIKNIRNEAGLTQPEFAEALEISSALVAMVETGQKEVSKKFVNKLAEKMDVHPASITPFLFVDKNMDGKNLSSIEKSLISLGEKMQTLLIKKRSNLLRKNVHKS